MDVVTDACLLSRGHQHILVCRMSTVKKWLTGGFVGLGLVAIGAWGYYEAMKRAWIRYNEFDIRSEGSLSIGDLAPDLELGAVDGSGSKRISDFYAEKPAVLIFGSYT